MTVVAWSCLLHGCDSYQGKQENWHCKVDRGFTTVVDASRPGVPLLVDKQLISIIGLKPDFKVGPLQFLDLYAEDDAYRNRAMNDIWAGYCQAKQELQTLRCVEGPDRWQDCQEFKKCTLWVYDESVHFGKPLHHGNWLRCLFCGEPRFSTDLFYLEHDQVIGAIGIHHDKPFRTVPK